MTGFPDFSFMASGEARCPKQKGRGRADFVFFIMMRREIKVSLSMGWFPININDNNTISSGNQSVKEVSYSVPSFTKILSFVKGFRLIAESSIVFLTVF